ncbi:MAG: M28 family peptidase [Candidatus Marinimicrobia bacterium]|nr:M28 family peptidase [Candidatus Neomarinimicrobiota bacterium]
MLFVLASTGCAYRQITVPEVIDSDFTTAYRNDLRTLSSDEFQGRRPGTPGGKKTQEYLINSFKSMGLEPGNNGSYLQEVNLISSKTTASGITAVGVDGDSLKMEMNTDILSGLKGESDTLSITVKELVFVGFGSESEKFNWDDYADIDVEGKIVIILRNHAGFARQDTSILNDPSSSKHQRFSTKFKSAKSHGALGALVIFDSTLSKSKYYWKQLARRASKGRNALYDGEADSSTLKLEAILNLGMGKQLLALAGYDYDSLVVAASTPGFKAFDLGITFNGEFTREQTIYSSNNVLALIRGAKRPDEVVIYTAHWDHLGMDEAMEGDNIFNGAADNGTGTASILSLARAFKAQPLPPKRSILFMGFTAEEMGLLGSKYYADNPVFPLGKSVASINIDMLNFGGATNDLIIFGSGNPIWTSMPNARQKN